jgi:hypothetical protein
VIEATSPGVAPHTEVRVVAVAMQLLVNKIESNELKFALIRLFQPVVLKGGTLK